MLLITLDDRSPQPKSRQIFARIRSLIDDGTLSVGDRLPSTRQLAGFLAIHRSTVALAYQELWALGYLEVKPGARPRVRARAPLAGEAKPDDDGLIAWSEVAAPVGNGALSSFRRLRPLGSEAEQSGVIDFSSLDLDPRLLPSDALRSCMGRVLRESGDALLSYGDPAGYRPLRQYIARRLQSHGITAGEDEILITNGSQQALDLIFRMAAAPGRSVAVESPTYDCVLPLLRLNGLRPVAVPLRSDGMDLEALARVLDSERPVLVYTMPSFQNPAGVSTTQDHRERLLALCEAHRTPIVEDAFDEEMKYFGRVVLPIKSMDRHQSVIYCGTFSKVLFPGIRIGWVTAARECIARLVAIRRFSDLTQNTPLQAALCKFCEDGHYDRHISRMHRVFRRRMQVLVCELRRRVRPEWASWIEPNGGYLVWLTLTQVRGRVADWPQVMLRHGVRVADGRDFFASEPGRVHLRLSIAGVDETEIAIGVRRLAAALSEIGEPEEQP